MVGVRSSRGCKACRRKKRGCDLSRPTCGQCQKIGAKCAYEDRSYTFVAPHERATRTHSPATIGRPSLLLTDRKQQLETTFWEAYLPSSESPHDTAFTHTVIATWIPTVRYLATVDRTTRLALDSCILMALGRMQDNPDSVQHGVAMYCQALTETNRALQLSATAQTDAMLATCALLAMCEKYRPHCGPDVSSQATDYQSHVEGTARLLELRGCQKHVSEHGFALFAHARPSIALTGITRRQKVLLDSQSWRQVPWSAQHRHRTLKDKLVDATLAVAGALERLDQYHEDPGTDLEVAKACATPVQWLRAWEIEALRLHSGGPSNLSDVCAKHGFGFYHLAMQFWAVSLLLSARCRPFIDHLTKQSDDGVGLSPALQALASLVPNPQICAINIATHAHHYFALTTGLVGPQHATFPLGAALHFFAATGQRASTSDKNEAIATTAGGGTDPSTVLVIKRLQELFRNVGRAKSTGEFLRSMAPDPAPAELKGDTNEAGQHEKMAKEWFKL
ncbi:hypothetical protein Q7P35_005740 [Cladosporium inversicolor]